MIGRSNPPTPVSRLSLKNRNSGFLKNLNHTIVLKNGLILEIYDQSRKIAGNRWLVKMAAKIDIPIDRLHLGDNLNKQVNLNSPKETFDNFIRHEQKRERNFIDEKEKDTVLNDLVTSFHTSAASGQKNGQSDQKRNVKKRRSKYGKNRNGFSSLKENWTGSSG